MTPGPGQYQSKQYVGKEGPKISMSSRPKTSLGRSTQPGPGQYNSSLVNRPKTPAYRIGSAKRDGGYKFSSDMPGPGQYSPTSLVSSKKPQSPLWSMGTGQRPGLYTSENIPGPGNYNVTKGLGDGPKVNYYNFSILSKVEPCTTQNLE